jgi:hypothetical protein
VSPQLRRFLPLIVVALLLLVLLPLLNRGHKSGLSSGDKADRTKEAMRLIDTGELRFKARTGRYTSHLTDLVIASKRLGQVLAVGIAVELDTSTNGRAYLARATGENLSLLRARNGAALTTNGCVVIKSGSGVDCKPAAGSGTTTGGTTTSGTTTG